MTRILLDATTLIALGTIGELDLLAVFDGELVVPPAIEREVTTEPAATNVARLLEREDVSTPSPTSRKEDGRAAGILDESSVDGDVRIVASVLAETEADAPVAVVSDDRRLRTVARGLGATVTGTIGAIVRAVEGRMPAEGGIALVRRVDEHGLHMTAELRERAYELVESASE